MFDILGRKIDLYMTYDVIYSGIKQIKGDIIFLLHSGDILADENILKKVSKIFKKNTDVLSGNIAYYDDQKKYITRYWNFNISKLNIKTFYKIPHTSIFIKKDIIKKIKRIFTQLLHIFRFRFFDKVEQIKKNFSYLNEDVIFMKTGGLSTFKKNCTLL